MGIYAIQWQNIIKAGLSPKTLENIWVTQLTLFIEAAGNLS